jgi:hypothetical protein
LGWGVGYTLIGVWPEFCNYKNFSALMVNKFSLTNTRAGRAFEAKTAREAYQA